jgi:hypothetical protein
MLTIHTVPMTYWAGNPNSYAWLNSSRPINPDPECTIYDDWRQGMSSYDNEYAAALVAKGTAAIEANFRTRRFVFARGLNDFGNDDSSCAPGSQGTNRGKRFFNFLNFFRPSKPQFVDYFPDVGHDAPFIYNSPGGYTRFFFDNWDGSGNYNADFGPRMLSFDNPNPDPDYDSKWGSYSGPRGEVDIPKPRPQVLTNSTAINPYVTNPANNMKYAGCFTDSPARSLATLKWSGNTTSTIAGCVGACANSGFTVAAVEFGTECFCGKQLANNATLVADKSCNVVSSGNEFEYAGGSWLLSVYNSGDLVIYTGPKLVETVGPYNSIGCWTDQGGARTLAGKTVTLGDKTTINTCADSCTGYNYFGTEYGVEVSDWSLCFI